MKKFTILLTMVFIFAGLAKGQMVEDFEHIPLNLMLGEETDNSMMSVVPNPDKGEGNPSDYVVKFERSMNGVPWGGFFSALPEPMDFTTMKYMHVKVWKPRVSPTKMKIEGGENIEIDPVSPQALTNEWESLVYHFENATGEYATLVFMPDFEDPLTLTEDIVLYFDDFVMSDSAEPGEGNMVVIEDFEFIPMNYMGGDETDTSTLSIVPNPDQENEVNTSAHVVEFQRSQFGVPWGGFWSALPTPLDLSENKYVYVKVWKPRISPVRFKVEGGNSDNLEIESMNPQTKVNEWEELVFDFSEKDGTWNVIAFMPDFEDPLTLTEDIVLYFDDIRVGPAPTVNVPSVDELSDGLLIFPNPARDVITIRNDHSIQSVEIIDVTGRVVQKQDRLNSSEVQLQFDGLYNGIYIVKVTSERGISNQKIRVNN
jgi:hypothetical protein